MINTANGAAIASCFKLIGSCGKEIEALADTLNNLFMEAISPENKLPCSLINEGNNYKYRMDDSGWVCTDIAYSLPLKSRGKKQKYASAYLGYQISMSGDGIAAPGNKEPLIHVFLWADKNDLDEMYMGYPTIKAPNGRVLNKRLIEWSLENPKKWSDRSWLFSLRLMSLNSSEDLKQRIINPILSLLRGETVLSALPDSMEGLIIYTDEDLIWDK